MSLCGNYVNYLPFNPILKILKKGSVSYMIQQVGGAEQSTQVFSKKINQATEDNFSKVLTSSTDKLETSEVDESIYDDIANKYDIRNMTFEELKEVAQELYEAGAITVKEVMTMTFDYGRATQSIKQAANGLAAPNFSMYETSADASGRRDWIAEFEARAAKDRQYGNLIGNANNTKIMNILQLLERE